TPRLLLPDFVDAPADQTYGDQKKNAEQ
ncbi:MAG: hypothetical protein K0Q83_1504, partial [Deltaproteobacteria bacterium]|nr:hypothetical protein [Deltaproteobacteria bacterium]